MATCLGLPGCSSWNLRGDGFSDAETSSEFRRLRAPDKDVEFWGFSNKARSIEQDLGVSP